MKCKIMHESVGRVRVRLLCGRMTLQQADILEYYLKAQPGVRDVSVYDRTCDAVISYRSGRSEILAALCDFDFADEEALKLVPEHTSRALNREFQDKLFYTICRRYFSKFLLPMPIRTAMTLCRSASYIREGLKALKNGKLTVEVLDAAAISVSMLQGNFNTAASVMFMLRIGEILDEWTHKKSVADLADAMSLNVDRVWLKDGDTEVLTPIEEVKAGDVISVRMGNMIPLDGRVVSGEATVNQASITGESLPVRKQEGSYVYAGTAIEEGQCLIRVEKTSGTGRYDRIMQR